ncbi:MAG: fused MFS/spermidine synthase [Rubrivivax sp.]|nr:fused MFS/spermidine synthase [Rubrivivax sp.]
MQNVRIRLLFALFAASGCTGLIYESVWTHYLKLFIGTAAFAQSFVLVVFMGGLALGAWLASRWSERFADPLVAYAAIEALIGLAALVFHELYTLSTAAALDHVIPALGSPLAVEVFKYGLCMILIAPQTVLLGMTFPLMSTAVIRREPQRGGHHLAMLYFTNSIGAAIGALAAAFWLLGWLGMPGTMRAAGVVNLALAAVVAAMARRDATATAAARVATGAAVQPGLVRLLLVAAFVTGAASFVYEIAWIRMLSLVLGTSFHAFELMLSAFITGLALGGLWIRRRIDAIDDPLRWAGWIQLAMGLAALATIFVYHRSFDWMVDILSMLNRSEAAYPLFNLFSHGIAFAVMLPATFFAGMTLPLFTHVLLRGGQGERAIGQVYAANTLGAIAGVLLAVHVLVPGAGVKLALVCGAAADMLLGATLLRGSQAAYRKALSLATAAAGMLTAGLSIRADVLQPERLASGVYRHGTLEPLRSRLVYYRDGKTASVAVRASPDNVLSIVTNGKPDASIAMDPSQPPIEDEHTMTLLAALPLAMHPQAQTWASIGFGSGLTAEVLLSHRGPARVDSIEIEPAMLEGARAYAPRVQRPFTDPRSRIVVEDAKSWFARHGQRYDVIVSEPSNPWVNGVAGLFTTEFYGDVKRYLAPGGLFVQWLQLYEFDDTLLASVLRALGQNFADYEVYAANSADLVLVAVATGRVPPAGPLPPGEPALLEQLRRVGVSRLEDLTARHVGGRRELEALFEPLQAPPNSDFRPFVQLQAPRARFAGARARSVVELAIAPLPIREMLGGAQRATILEPAPSHVLSAPVRAQSTALAIARALMDPAADPWAQGDAAVRQIAVALRVSRGLCTAEPAAEVVAQLHRAAEGTLAHLALPLRQALWVQRPWLTCAGERPAASVQRRLDLYAAIAQRDARRMLELSQALLESPGRETQRDWGQFLLSTALLGARAQGEGRVAQQLWARWGGALFPGGAVPPPVVYLLNLP